MRKTLLIASTLLTLTACTNAEMQEYNMNHGMNAATSTRQKCMASVNGNEKYASIVGHLQSTDTYAPTLSELNNGRKPTAQEAALVAQYRDDSIGCDKALVQSLMQFAPSIAPVFVEMQNEKNNTYSRLINRRISWGTFAKENQRIQSNAMAEANQKWQILSSQLAAQKQAESIQLQNALAQAAQMNMYQQQMQAMQQSRQLNCTTMYTGNFGTLNCY